MDSLTFGMMNALKTGNRTLDLFVVAFLPTLIALVVTFESRVRSLASRTYKASKLTNREPVYERVVRVETRATRWGSGRSVDEDSRNEVLHKAIALHLCRVGALKGEPDARLRLLATGKETAAGPSWDQKYGSTAKDLGQYGVVTSLPDDAWIDIAPGLRVIRAVDDGSNDDDDAEGGKGDNEKGRDATTASVDFRFESRGSAEPIDAFLQEAFDAYVTEIAAREASAASRFLYRRAVAPAAKKDDDGDGGDGAPPAYKRYALASSKTFKSLFFPEKVKLLNLLDAFSGKKGKFGIPGFPRKLGVLLHGPPGTGKTSLIKAIAHRTGRSIVSVPLGHCRTNQELMDAIFDLRFDVAGVDVPVKLSFSQTVFVLEDVDCISSIVRARTGGGAEEKADKEAPDLGDDPLSKLFTLMMASDGDAEKTSSLFKPKEDADKLDLSGILNVLDGVVDTPGRILIMTTNHPEALDPALVRPGRVDLKLRLGHVAEAEAREMVEHYVLRAPLGVEEAAAFGAAWADRETADLTPAALEQICASCDALDDVAAALRGDSSPLGS